MIKWGSVFLCLCLGLLAFSALSGCTPRQAAPEIRPALTVAVPQGSLSDALEAAALEYAQSGGELVQVIAIDSQSYSAQVDAALLAGTDRFDLVYLPGSALGKWVGYHTLHPYPAVDPAGLEAWLPPLTVEGQLYGLPVQPDVVVLWYRADLLQEAGLPPPASWDEFRQAAVKLNAPPETLGAVAAGSDLDSAADFAAVLASFGGQALQAGADGYQVSLESEPARQALEFYAGSFLAGQHSGKGETFTRASVVSTLQDGRAVLGIAPLSAAAVLRDCQASPLTCRGDLPQWTWAWLPNMDAERASGSVDAWAVPMKAGRAQAAQRFAAWLTGPQGGQVWARHGGTPAHTAVLSGDGAPEEWLALARVEQLVLPLPPISTSDALWRAYHAAVHSAAAGDQPPAAALKSAAQDMRRALRMGGY